MIRNSCKETERNSSKIMAQIKYLHYIYKIVCKITYLSVIPTTEDVANAGSNANPLYVCIYIYMSTRNKVNPLSLAGLFCNF